MKKAIAVALVVALGSAAQNTSADFTFGPATNLGPGVNSTVWDGGPAVSPNGLELYFYSFLEGFGIPTVRIAARQSNQDPWGDAQNASGLPFVGTSMCFSADGLTLLYESFQAGGLGQTDIWMTTRATLSDSWGPPLNLGSGVNSSATDMGASLSSDGLELYFGSDRPGGSGDWDVYVSTRATTADPWGVAVNLGPEINSAVYDGHPHIAPDDLTLFVTSARPGGYGDWDIWFTKRRDRQSSWGPLVNVGPALNTAGGEVEPYISADGRTLYYSDGYVPRSGGVGGTDLWQVPIVPVIDFNGDGHVDGFEVRSIAENWSTDDSFCDIGPMPWGNGVVDVEDLKVLAGHIGHEVDDPTLIAYWALDEAEGEVAHDNVGGSDAAALGGITWCPGAGRLGGALELDGIDGRLVTDFVLNPADGPFSVSVWVKGGAPGQAIVAQKDSTRPGAAWISSGRADGALMTNLMFPLPPLVSETAITDGRWHRVVLVWNGERRNLCVDGVVVASDLAPVVATIPSDGSLNIGCGKDMAPGTFFSGMIDDVRIYNRAVRP